MTFTAAIVAVLIILVGYADYWTTQRVIANGGKEIAPVMAWAMDRFGQDWLYFKMGLHAAIALAVGLLDQLAVSIGGMVFILIILGVSIRNLRV